MCFWPWPSVIQIKAFHQWISGQTVIPRVYPIYSLHVFVFFQKIEERERGRAKIRGMFLVLFNYFTSVYFNCKYEERLLQYVAKMLQQKHMFLKQLERTMHRITTCLILATPSWSIKNLILIQSLITFWKKKKTFPTISHLNFQHTKTFTITLIWNMLQSHTVTLQFTSIFTLDLITWLTKSFVEYKNIKQTIVVTQLLIIPWYWHSSFWLKPCMRACDF